VKLAELDLGKMSDQVGQADRFVRKELADIAPVLDKIKAVGQATDGDLRAIEEAYGMVEGHLTSFVGAGFAALQGIVR